MKKLIFPVIALLFGVLTLQAKTVDRSLADAAAQKFATVQFAAERATPELVYTGAGEAFYVYNVGSHSFVIIAGDDAHRPVIGYSGQSAFDASDIPPALAYYLDGVAECIERMHEATATPDVAAEWNSVLQHGRLMPRHNRGTGYFCTTQWNQSYPYNCCCPDDPAGSGGHAIVGCLATAMSQLMRFWAYPIQGIGSHCYYHSDYGQICADFGNTTYDWDNMPNVLNNSSTEAEKLATGTLCFHCGVTIDMGYGPDGSGGASGPIPGVMHTYFNYSDAIVQLSRNDYGTDLWKSMVREQFDMGWPMYYGGCQDGGCHAFVCDGYDDNDMFHFNLGWGGSSDGWYLIDDAPYTHPADAMFNFVPAEVYNQTPSEPYNLQARTESDAELRTILTWTNPTTTLNTDTLTSIEEIVVLRDNEIIATMTDVMPGAFMEFEDTDVPRYDVFHYAVYAVANGRIGKHANVMRVLVGPYCNWKVIITSNDSQGWRGGYLTAYSATGRVIWTMTSTNSVPAQFPPHMPLGQVSFGWSAPTSTVNQMGIIIKDADDNTVYSFSGSSDDLPAGIIFEANNNCGNDMICESPQNLVATTQDDAILLTWDAVEDPGYGYQVYRDNLLYRLIPSGTTFLDEAATLGGHCYRVGLLCEGGESPESSNESCASAGPCYPPRDLDYELNSNNKIKLTWKAPLPDDGRLTGYYLYRKEGAEGEYHRIRLMGPGATNYTDNSLIAQGDYYYRLYAYYDDLDCTSAPANRHYYPNVFELHAYYSPTGLEETEAEVKVYPNPTQGQVTIEAEGLMSVTVYNALGQCVMQQTLSGAQSVVDLKDAAKGLYLLRIATLNGIVLKRISIE